MNAQLSQTVRGAVRTRIHTGAGLVIIIIGKRLRSVTIGQVGGRSRHVSMELMCTRIGWELKCVGPTKELLVAVCDVIAVMVATNRFSENGQTKLLGRHEF